MPNFGQLIFSEKRGRTQYYITKIFIFPLLCFALIAFGFFAMYGVEMGWHNEDFGPVVPYFLIGIGGFCFLATMLSGLLRGSPYFSTAVYESGFMIVKGLRRPVYMHFNEIDYVQDIWTYRKTDARIYDVHKRHVKIMPKIGRAINMTLLTGNPLEPFVNAFTKEHLQYTSRDWIQSDVRNISNINLSIDRRKHFVLNRGRLDFDSGGVVLDLKDLKRTYFEGRTNTLDFYKSIGEMEEKVISMPLKSLVNYHIFSHVWGLFTGEGAESQTDSEMKQFEREHRVSPQKQSQLVLGAILAYNNYESARIFKHLNKGFTIEKHKEHSAYWWGVTDRAGAIDTLNRLTRVHNASNDAERMVQEGNLNELYAQTRDLLMSLPGEDAYTHEEIASIPSYLAWDMGRAVYLARNFANVGYITEEEAWEYIHDAAFIASEKYDNWRHYLAAYLFGRALTFAAGTPDSMRPSINFLLRDPSSPYKDTPFPKDVQPSQRMLDIRKGQAAVIAAQEAWESREITDAMRSKASAVEKRMVDDKFPLLTLEEFFKDNTDEFSIAPNGWGFGRPTLAEIWARLRKVEARSDVAWVRVALHFDTDISRGLIECKYG